MPKSGSILVRLGGYRKHLPLKKVKKAFGRKSVGEIKTILRVRCACIQPTDELTRVVCHFGELPEDIERRLVKLIT